MPRKRVKPYKGGDKITIQLPKNPDNKLLYMLNSTNYVSPRIIELLTDAAQKMNFKKKQVNMDNINKIIYVKEE